MGGSQGPMAICDREKRAPWSLRAPARCEPTACDRQVSFRLGPRYSSGHAIIVNILSMIIFFVILEP
jgi:hypothetical protein